MNFLTELNLMMKRLKALETFNINSQLSIESKSKILIIPNTNSKESTNKRTSLIKYLDKKSIVWIKRFKLFKWKN